MSVVPVKVGKGYQVHIGSGLLSTVGELVSGCVTVRKAAVITDETVAGLYLERVLTSLQSAGFQTVSFAFPAGEKSKQLRTLEDILEFLAQSELSRDDLVVALGGGVVGDVAGFASAVYMRGVSYVQIPTTLLAAVDSSVGGKTAVDLSSGKNLAGRIVQPEIVVFDIDTLVTLPDAIISDGMAEVIKTAVLSGEELFSQLEDDSSMRDLEEIITCCVMYKASIVESDEHEKGKRKLLNLGHTAGHAIERLSGYTISHGHAVAIGLAIIVRAAYALDIADADLVRRVLGVLLANGLPTTTGFSAEQLAHAATVDKKRRGESITLVIPQRIGECKLQEFALAELKDLFALGTGD